MSIAGMLPLGAVGAFAGSVTPTVQMARLGNFAFGIDTLAFDELRRRSNYDWQVMRRVGRAVANQFVGEGDDEINLPGTLYPAFRGGLGQITTLREMAASGLPHRLMYELAGASSDAGLWVITSIDETRKVLLRNGLPRAVDFSITIRAYGDDGPQQTKNTGDVASLTSLKAVGLKAAPASLLASVSAVASATPAGLSGVMAARDAARTMASFAANPAGAASTISSITTSGAKFFSAARASLGEGISILAPFAPAGSLDPISRAIGGVSGVLATLEGMGSPQTFSEIMASAERLAASASGAIPGLRDAVNAIDRVRRVTDAAFSVDSGPQAAAAIPAIRAMGNEAASLLSGAGLIAESATAVKERL